MKVIPKSIHHLLDDSKGGIKKSYLEENYYDKDYIDDNFVSEADVSNFVTIQGPLQTVLGEKKLKNISLLNIPGTAPSSSDIDSGKSYLYSSYGSYAEVPGGGGGGVGETLTVTKNGSAWLSYNGSQAVSLNLAIPTTVASLSDASDYATKTWVENKGYITSAALSGYVTIATDQEITGAKYFSNALAIPLSAPSSPTSGLSYLYAGSGSYAEEPGGGVADVYPLTITKNGSSWLYYDPGEAAVSVNLSVPTKVSDLTNDTGFITSSALTGYATQTWVENKGYITSSALTGYVNDFEVTGSGNAVTTGSKSGSKITLTKGNTFVDLTSAQTITGAKKHANVALLNIPTSISSSDIESGKVYLYSGSGEYAEEASGGVADVYPLYLVIGGTTTTYDPASESTTVTFGSAAKKGYTTSITQGSADLPTSGAVYSAIAAAVTSALHYRGMSSTALTDGGTETAIIGGVALVPQSGDVVIYNGLEFLWEKNSSNIYVWNKLGDDTSYAKKTYQIIAGTGLTGGGYLSGDVTLYLSSATITSLGKADTAVQPGDHKTLTLKVGTSIVQADYNALAAKTYTISKTNITDTIGSTTYAPYHADGYLPLSAGSGKALTGDLYFDSSSAAKYIKYKKSSTTMNAITMAKNGDIAIGSEDLQNTTNGTISFYSNQMGFLWGPTNDAEYLYFSGSYITTNAYLGSPNDRIYRAYLEKLDAATSIETAGTLSVGGVSTFTGKLLPSATNATDIGSSSKYFKDGYLHGWLYVTNIGHPQDAIGTMGTSSYRWSQIYASNTNSNVVRANDLLGIPTVAPQSGSVVSGEAYLYSSTGSYAETPGGGVANVYPLTITKNGSAWLYYNPGVQAESINLSIPTKVSDLTNDTGFITASSIPSTYAWSAITNTPTTLSGYGITDAKIETPSGTSNRKITLGSNNFTIYSWALASAKPSYTLDEVADGSTRKLANYLPLSGNSVATKITGNVILGNNVFLQGVHTNGTDVRELIGLDNNNIVTVGCSTNQLRLITSSVDIKHNKNGTLYNVYDESNLTKSVLTTLLDSNSGYYLPLTGGSLTNASFGGSLTINRNSTGGDSVICYKANTTVYGYMGIRANNTPVFYSGTDINTVNTILHSGNYSTWAVPRKDGVRFYPYIGTNSSASFGAQWFKVTLSHNGQAAGANRWYMLSMDLVINSAYSTSNPPTPIKGTVHLQYYFSYNNSQGVYSAGIVKGMFTGMNYPSLQIKYDPANPAIFYVKTNGGTNIYNTLSIENMMANDSAANIDYSTTTIVGIAEADIPSTATSEVPIDSYLPLTAGSSYPLTGDLYLNASSHRYIKYIDNASTPVTHNAITMYNNGNLVLGEGNRALGNTTYVEGGSIQLVFNNSEDRRIIIGANYMRPDVDNQLLLGTSSYRWNTVYATAVSASTYYGTLYDFVYLTNHPYNVDDAAVKGVNFHYANAGTKPTGSQDGSAFTLAWSSAWVTQMYGDWRTNKFYTRVKTNGTWGDWAELATTKGTVEGLNTSTESDATFTYRAVPSVAVGDVARATKVKGKTIVWNQLVPTNWFATNTPAHVSWTNNGDGSYTINGTASGVGQVIAFTPRKSFGDHKYYLATSDSTIAIYFNGTSANQGTYTDSRQIVTAQASDTYYPCIRFQSGATFSNKKVYIKIIDLTLMFGKGSEPASVAEFEALYPLPYYAYNPGELISNKTESIETTGFNIWDEELLFGYTINDTTGAIATTSNHIISKNPIPVLPNTLYNIYIAPYAGSSGYGVPIYCYDGNMNYLGRLVTTGASPTFTTPANCMYIRFRLLVNEYGTSYANNICINLSDTTKNGTYEPYRKDTLPLNITKLKVDTTNLWDGIYEAGIYDSNGAKTASSNSWRNVNPIPVSGGKIYYTNYILFRYYYDAAMNFISYDNSGSYTFTTPANAVYMNIRQSSETAPKFSVWINTPNKRPPLKLNQQAKAYDSTDWVSIGTSYSTKSTDSTTQEIVVSVISNTSAAKGVKLNNFTSVTGHKYYIRGEFTATCHIGMYGSNHAAVANVGQSGAGIIGTATSSVSYFGLRTPNGATSGSTYRFKNIVCIDLTEMFGSGMEPTSPGEFEQLVGLSYIPYGTNTDVPYYVFHQGLTGAGTGYDEVVGNKAIRRIGCIDLGACNWTYASSTFISSTLVGLVVEQTNAERSNVICKKYVSVAYSELSSIDKSINIIFAGSSLHGRIYIKDSSYTDVTTFAAAVAGTKLYFQLATPIEYDLETAVPELIECDVLGTQRRLPEDTASSVQAPFHCDFQYGANPGEIVSDSAYRYLPLAGGTVTGTLECKGELIVPDHAPYQPEPNKHYLYVNDNGNYYQS